MIVDGRSAEVSSHRDVRMTVVADMEKFAGVNVEMMEKIVIQMPVPFGLAALARNHDHIEQRGWHAGIVEQLG